MEEEKEKESGNERASKTTSDRWVYPSHQQFYNALKRKGFETDEEDIPMIVHIHNEMNEQCWQEILRWERQHSEYSKSVLFGV
jgi:cytochrome c heme-lyase